MEKFILFIIFIFISACSLSVDQKALKNKEFEVTLNDSSWREISPDISDYAFRHSDGKVLFFNSLCKKYDFTSLEVLKNNLFHGVEKLDLKEENEVKILNRKGLSIRATGEIDGVPVGLRAKIFNKDHCTYDIVLIAPAKLPAHKIDPIFSTIEQSLRFNK